MAYELPHPYDYAALEPFIDAETMKLHQTSITGLHQQRQRRPRQHPDSPQIRRRPDAATWPDVPEDSRGVVRATMAEATANHTAF